jgi:heme-degrading monooxygenase HmoA
VVEDTDETTKGETLMEHIRIATYTMNKGNFQELAETAKTGMLPKFQHQPGFISYGLADMGDRTIMSISMWETREQAEAATPLAETWVGEHLADHVQLRSNTVGDLAFFEGVPATV